MMSSSHPNEHYAFFSFKAFDSFEGDSSTQTSKQHQLRDRDSINGLFPTSPFFDSSTPHFSTNPILPLYFSSLLPSVMAIPENPKSAAAAAFKVENRLRTAPRIRVNLSHRKYFSSVDNRVPPECQADGCTADLSAAKHYYRRHKVCEFHSKAAAVFLPGRFPQRFCQQCSRFQDLAVFDNAKRSCRKSLTEHNRRRRSKSLASAKATLAWSSAPMTTPKEESTAKSNVLSGNDDSLAGEEKKALNRFTSSSALSLGGVVLPVLEHREPAYNVSEKDKGIQYHQLQNQSQFECFLCSTSNAYHLHHENLFHGRSHSMEGAWR